MAHPASRKRKPSSADRADNAGASSKRVKQDRDASKSGLHKPQPAPLPASTAPPSSSSQAAVIKQDLLVRYYPRVESLRSYLIARLPASSRIRRKRLASFGKRATASPPDDLTQQRDALELLLSRTLDTALVGYSNIPAGDEDAQDRHKPDRQQLRVTFSQAKRADESNVTISDATSGPSSLQAEIVDFAVWLMFKRAAPASSWHGCPPNVLCHGFQRNLPDEKTCKADAPESIPPCTIPGLFASRRPQNAQLLKELPWPQLLALLGASGEKIMTDLLMDCSLFLAVDSGEGNYIQATGSPLFSVPFAKTEAEKEKHSTPIGRVRQLSGITLVRNRIFYAPGILTKGSIRFGLHRIHVLNRYPYLTKPSPKASSEKALENPNYQGTVRTALYIFPRQFGLHNVFTSAVDRSQTNQRFQDYTLRDTEIASKYPRLDRRGPDGKIPVPKRLRGMPLALVEKMRARHKKCAHAALLDLYCPARNGRHPDGNDSDGKPSPLVDLAVPLAQVSAFCKAVIQKVVPGDFWGAGDVRVHNKTAILQSVDTFIRLSRYESPTLHGLVQGLKISEIEWLAPPGLRGSKVSKTDMQKRQEIFAEFVYYLFDSFLIPLIRGHFYVTESSTHRNRIFFFRHDVWRRITEPALASIKTARFDRVTASEATRITDAHRLGCGRIRLLPKGTSVRTIMNLSRRVMKSDASRLSTSTNTILEPVSAMLNYEMKQNPQRLGSSMQSTHSIYERLREFRARFDTKKQPAFYFAKVDVKSAFDTIPQDAMVKLIGSIPSHEYYHIDKHTEITAPKTGSQASHAMVNRKWRSIAKADTDASTFHDCVEASYAPLKKNTVFVDAPYRRIKSAESLAVLAAYHVKHHIVQIGKTFYRQKEGIPQGSILSSTLCSYFYADLEKTELGFLDPAQEQDGSTHDCLLLRLIDDFLLITTDYSKAARFVEVMHRGHPRYGVQVNPNKSLVNFDLAIGGKRVPRHTLGAPFPYCGVYINTSNLNLAKDRESKKQPVFDSLTVERYRTPGDNFKRKTLVYFKYQAFTMFFDMSYNSRRTTLHNLHSALVETANKMWAYAHCIPKAQRPSAALTIKTIESLSQLAYAVLSSKSRESCGSHYKFTVSKVHLKLILLHAFSKVLGKKQTSYKEVLAWMQKETLALKKSHRLRLLKEFTE